jgi:hypothetical protein
VEADIGVNRQGRSQPAGPKSTGRPEVKRLSCRADDLIEKTMATKVNYDDNLFYLHSLIKALRGGLQLELDIDYFRDKVVEDIFFVDRTLQQIYETLRVNSYLINRRDHLRELMRVKRGLADLLGALLDGTLPWFENLAAFSDKLAGARDHHVRDIADIQGLMEGGVTADDPQDVVSQDEYRFLFEAEQDTEGE